jgi:hypothetical protein
MVYRISHLFPDENVQIILRQIYFSIVSSVINLLLIYIEQLGYARALEIETPTYLFMSLNGLIGYVPYASKLRDPQFRQTRMIDQPLDLEKIYGNVSILTFKFEYKFGKSTCRTFIEGIQSMPWVDQQDQMPVIDFGDTLELCGIMIICLMLKNAN